MSSVNKVISEMAAVPDADKATLYTNKEVQACATATVTGLTQLTYTIKIDGKTAETADTITVMFDGSGSITEAKCGGVDVKTATTQTAGTSTKLVCVKLGHSATMFGSSHNLGLTVEGTYGGSPVLSSEVGLKVCYDTYIFVLKLCNRITWTLKSSFCLPSGQGSDRLVEELSNDHNGCPCCA